MISVHRRHGQTDGHRRTVDIAHSGITRPCYETKINLVRSTQERARKNKNQPHQA